MRGKTEKPRRRDALLETFGVPSTFCSDAGIWRPLTALTTDTAGVMMPSPIRAPAAQLLCANAAATADRKSAAVRADLQQEQGLKPILRCSS